MKNVAAFLMVLAFFLSPDCLIADSYSMDDGRRIFNVVDDFIAYAEKNTSSDNAARRSDWDAMLEGKYPQFFAEVIYRGLTGAELASYKGSIIDQFWSEVYPKIDVLKTLNEIAPRKMLDGRSAFKSRFPNFNPGSDYFITVSFSFSGKVVTYSDDVTRVLVIGLENFTPEEPEQLDITIAHEHIHLYHFHINQNFSTSGGLYRKIWAEGLAVYGSEEIQPGHRLSRYLSFSVEKMNQIYYLFYDLVDHLSENIDSTDQGIVRAYIGAEENRLWIPNESGYFLGYFIVWELSRQGHSLADMLTWSASTARGYMLTSMPRMDVLDCSYRLSGNVRESNGIPIENVLMNGLPGEPSTDASGYYSTTLQCHETGAFIPLKAGFSFEPQTLTYGPGNSLDHLSDINFSGSGTEDEFSNAQWITSFYVAYWDRAPDAEGHAYWLGMFNRQELTIPGIAENFAMSAEAKAAYPYFNAPHAASDSQINDFVRSVYRNLLDREVSASDEGVVYWVGELRSGKTTPGAVIGNIIYAAMQTGGADWQTIWNKVAQAQQSIQ